MGGRAKNLVFPPARIKRMMRSDKEVGKIAVSAPFLVSKALQLALEDFLTTAAELARQKKVSVITPYQLRLCVEREKRFRSLQRVVEHVPLPSVQEEEKTSEIPKTRKKNKEEKTDEKRRKKKVSSGKRVAERNGGKKRKSTTKQSKATKKDKLQAVENVTKEHPSETEQCNGTTAQSTQDTMSAVPVPPPEILKVSLQSTANEDNYDED